jgi:hypothetical protein
MKRKLTKSEKKLLIGRLVALVFYGIICMVIGSGVSLFYWVMDSVYNNENTPFLIVVMFSGWLIIGAFMGVLIRPRHKH